MPNYGTTSKEGLLQYVKENSIEGIYTTFIGVGVDFNIDLIFRYDYYFNLAYIF